MKALLTTLALLFTTTALAETGNIYTSILPEHCVAADSSDMEENPEIDYYFGECPGLGGYQVIISGGDLRYDLSLKYRGQDIMLFEMGMFHDLGSDNIEWIYKREGIDAMTNKIIYKALIFRINYTDYTTDDMVERSVLVVAKLDGAETCIAGTVYSKDTKKNENMNEKARAIANSEMQCQR